MNKIFTQIALGVVCLFANVANAQVNENFNSTLPTCFLIENSTVESGAVLLPNNTTTTGVDIPVHIQTPYFNFTTTTASVTFSYTFGSNINGNKSRTFRLGTVNQNGVITYSSNLTYGNSSNVSLIDIKNNSLAGTITVTFPIQLGTQRIIISYAGDGGKARGTFDDLKVNSNYHYSNPCNTRPVATNNEYQEGLRLPITGNLMIDETPDSDPNTESIQVANVTLLDPTAGSIVWSPNGKFTFTPYEYFRGGVVTLNYQVIDNGYSPLLSNIGVVTLEYPELTILPVHFTSFSGNVANNKAALTWNVADNETGSHFEIERSADGKSFKAISTMFTSNQVGNATYTYTDAGFVTTGSFYRIKVVNKDNTTSYSKIISIKGATAVDNKIVLMQNPVQSSLNFSFTSVADETNEVTIYNLAGVKMHSQKVQARKGSNSVSLSLDSRFIRGNYILNVKGTSANRSSQFIKL